jgi:hypothetical protein
MNPGIVASGFERYEADPEQRLFHLWQMGIEEMAYGRVRVVRLPELSDSSGSLSCSKTVTEWPCRASIIATESPMTPPPSTRIVDIPPQQ